MKFVSGYPLSSIFLPGGRGDMTQGLQSNLNNNYDYYMGKKVAIAKYKFYLYLHFGGRGAKMFGNHCSKDISR